MIVILPWYGGRHNPLLYLNIFNLVSMYYILNCTYIKKMVLKSHETLLLSFFFFGSPSKSDDDVHAFSGETFDD